MVVLSTFQNLVMTGLNTVMSLDKGQVLAYLGPLILVLFWIWGRIDNQIVAYYASRYRALDPPKTRNWTSQDVAIICTTVGTKRSTFLPALKSWLANFPRRIIIVTVPSEEQHVRDLVNDPSIDVTGWFNRGVHIIVLASPKRGKRVQIVHGLRHMEGGGGVAMENVIVCNVDNHVTWKPGFLKDMVRCFEDPAIGGVSGPCAVALPSYPDSPTLAEALAARVASKRNPSLLATYACSQWAWCLTGTSSLYRANILCDPKFYQAYLEQRWLWGSKGIEAGEDCTISRYLMWENWKMAMQFTPDTETVRVPKKTWKQFSGQMFRWERSTIRHMLSCLFVPAVWKNAYVLRKTVERVFRPVISLVHIGAWISALVTCPRFTFALFLYYLYELLPGYAAFFANNPSTLKYFWAVVLVDYFYLVQDVWCWLTLGDESWVTDMKKEN